MTHTIVHNRAQSRFETTVEGNLCILDYRRDDSIVNMNHVGVPRPVEGRGIAADLTQTALDWARAEDLQVVPSCPYVAAWIKRHPDYQAGVHRPQ